MTDTKVAHSGGTATETEQARCSVCNAPYGELLPGETVIPNVSISDFNTNFDTYVSSLEVVKVTGIIYAGDNTGLYITDASGNTLYVYCNHTGLSLSIGQEVTFTGTAKLYYSLPEFNATSITVSSNIPGVDITIYNGTIEQIINANASQAEKVFDHKVYRTVGVLTKDGNYYYLVDGENKLQLKTSTFADDYNNLIAFEGKRIRVDIVLSDCFSNTGIFRVSPLTGDNANVIEVTENNVPIVSIAAFNSNFDAYATSLDVVAVTGLIYAGDNSGLYITDASGNTLYVYCNHTGLGLSIGQEVTFTGTAKLYYSLPEFNATSITVSSNIPGVDITVYNGTIAQIINANASQAEKVFDHKVYRTVGVLTQDGNSYYLVDGENKLQIKSSTYTDDYNNLITYVGKKISVNLVLSDCFSTTGIFRVSPLVGTDAQIEEVDETGGETPDTPEDGTPTDINFVMINDTHGAFIDSDAGYSIGRVDSLVEALEADGGDYIFIHNGDAFQGSYVCGETYGLALLEALNASGVDCFVIGNHEFDWGIDKIAAYADGNAQNGEANFPFLGANIFYKGTTTRPDWIDAYTIIEQDGVKVGVIGIMGDDQESSILTRYVKDYDFVDPIDIIEETAAYLRTTAGCGVVVVAAHDYTPETNTAIAALSGNSRIDAIFCAHTHQNISETVTRSDSVSIPVVQCNHKNLNAQEVIITITASGAYDSFSATKYYPANYDISDDVQTIIDKYQYLIDEANEVIGTTANELYKGTLGAYAVDAMLNNSYSGYNFGDVDIAIMNTGGVRATINEGDITRAEIFEVFPFNNAVVLVNMSGKLIKELYGNNKDYLYMGIDDSVGNYTSLFDNTMYQLAVIDYVFEYPYYSEQFSQITADNYVLTDVILRNLVIDYIDNAY